MCGILAVFNSKRNLNELKQAQYEMIHRSPDYQSGKEWIFSSEIAPLQKIINSSLDEFGLRQLFYSGNQTLAS